MSDHFDELQPFRIIQAIKHEPNTRDLPLLLIRALPLHLSHPNTETLKVAHTALGVTDFLSLQDLAQEHGRDRAVEIFRNTVGSIPRPR